MATIMQSERLVVSCLPCVQSYMAAPVAAVLAGGLPAVLREALNTSAISDMAKNAGMYQALLALVRCLASSQDLLPVLLAPGQWPAWLSPPDHLVRRTTLLMSVTYSDCSESQKACSGSTDLLSAASCQCTVHSCVKYLTIRRSAHQHLHASGALRSDLPCYHLDLHNVFLFTP
jgi:hypothetical protein